MLYNKYYLCCLLKGTKLKYISFWLVQLYVFALIFILKVLSVNKNPKLKTISSNLYFEFVRFITNTTPAATFICILLLTAVLGMSACPFQTRKVDCLTSKIRTSVKNNCHVISKNIFQSKLPLFTAIQVSDPTQKP